jgi:hypothetical protein
MSRWNFEDIMDKMMPIFEQKVAFSQEAQSRELSLKEKTEERRLDLEYKKLDAQITTDKDKLAFEKEKLTVAVKADYDLQSLKNSGLLDTERLKGLNEKELQGIRNAGLKDTEMYKANMETLPKLFASGKGQKIKNADGSETIMPENPEAQAAAKGLSQRMNLTPTADEPPVRNVAGEAAFAADVLRQHEKNGTNAEARNYLNSLPKDTQAATLALLNPGAAGAPAPRVAAANVASGTAVTPVRTDVNTTQAAPVQQPGEWRGLNTELGKPAPSARPIYEPGVDTSANTFGSTAGPSPAAVSAIPQAAAAPVRPTLTTMPKAFGQTAQPASLIETPAQRKNRQAREARQNLSSFGG